MKRRRTRLFPKLVALAGVCACVLGAAQAGNARPEGAAGGAVSRAVSLSGMLELLHADNFRAGRASDSFSIRTAKGRIPVRFAGRSPRHLAGSPVRLTGRFGRGVLHVGATKRLGLRRLATRTAAARRVAVVLFNFASDTRQHVSADEVRSVMFTAPDSVNAYFQEQSFGATSFTGAQRADGDVFGWYTIPNNPSRCSYRSWGPAAASLAKAEGVDLSAYDHTIYVFPSVASCPWLGSAQTPGKELYIHGPFTLRVVGHEIGHNLGVHHAASYRCMDATGRRTSLGGTCIENEYGDPFDIMGAAASRHGSNFHKAQWGWLSEQTIGESGTYALAPAAHPVSESRLLRIPRPSGTFLYLEYRQPFGTYFEKFSPDDPAVLGVSIRLAEDLDEIELSRLIDTVPESGSFDDAPLGVGRTFTDTRARITITTESISPAGAVVRIELGRTIAPPPPPPPPPPPLTQRCLVPNVKGKTRLEAVRALARANCVLGKVTMRPSASVKSGRVVSSSAKPGTRLPARAKVSLVVSRGKR